MKVQRFDEIEQQLKELGTKKQSEFSTTLIPGSKEILGVKIPILRKMAKEIAKEDWQGFVRECPEHYFEQQTLKAFVLGYAKDDLTKILKEADVFIPKIQDWSVCDSFCQTFKIARKYPKEVFEWLSYYGKKEEEYSQRVVAVMMLSHFLTEEDIEKVLSMMDELSYPGYYTKMGVAWCVATAYAKFPVKTMEYLKHNQLKTWTYNKAIQKMLESYRVSEKDKVILRGMKV